VRKQKLKKILPKRFNPKREAWLPILHTLRGQQHFTALFSNTVRAHIIVAPNDSLRLTLYRPRTCVGDQTKELAVEHIPHELPDEFPTESILSSA
jgi:putative hydrolase